MALLLGLPVVPVTMAETVRDVTMGRDEVHLQLPESSIDTIVGAKHDGQVLLHLRWPGLVGYHDGHENEYPEDLPAYNNMVRVLLTLSDRINPLQERYRLNVRYRPTLKRYPPTMGLEHWGQDAPDRSNADTFEEVYFLPGAGEQVETYIACGLPGMVWRSPGCHAEFYVGSFLARASYSRVFLPQWRAIQDGVRERVLSFVAIGPASHD